MNHFIYKVWDELKKHKANFAEGFRPPVVQTAAFENPTWSLRLLRIKCTVSGALSPTPLGRNFLLLVSTNHLSTLHTTLGVGSSLSSPLVHHSSAVPGKNLLPTSFFNFFSLWLFAFLLPHHLPPKKTLNANPKQVGESSPTGWRPHLQERETLVVDLPYLIRQQWWRYY